MRLTTEEAEKMRDAIKDARRTGRLQAKCVVCGAPCEMRVPYSLCEKCWPIVHKWEDVKRRAGAVRQKVETDRRVRELEAALANRAARIRRLENLLHTRLVDMHVEAVIAELRRIAGWLEKEKKEALEDRKWAERHGDQDAAIRNDTWFLALGEVKQYVLYRIRYLKHRTGREEL